MIFEYNVYGLRLQTHTLIPGLEPAEESAEVDVQVELGRPLSDVLGSVVSCGPESVQFDSNGLRFGVVQGELGRPFYHWTYQDDGTEFLVDHSGSHIWADWYEKETIENTASYLLGPILAFVLRLRGITSLHASVIKLGDYAIALLGPPRAGKSTTAMCFVMRGHTLVTDSVAPLKLTPRSGFQVQSGFPRIRLWPDSASLLFGSEQTLCPILSRTECWLDWNKGYVDLTKGFYRFERKPVSLGAVYVLSDSETPCGEFALETLTAREGLVELMANEYSNYLPYHQLNKQGRAREFETLVRLATRVPLHRVVLPADRVPPDELCDRIADDFRRLRLPSALADAGERTGDTL